MLCVAFDFVFSLSTAHNFCEWVVVVVVVKHNTFIAYINFKSNIIQFRQSHFRTKKNNFNLPRCDWQWCCFIIIIIKLINSFVRHTHSFVNVHLIDLSFDLGRAIFENDICKSISFHLDMVFVARTHVCTVHLYIWNRICKNSKWKSEWIKVYLHYVHIGAQIMLFNLRWLSWNPTIGKHNN